MILSLENIIKLNRQFFCCILLINNINCFIFFWFMVLFIVHEKYFLLILAEIRFGDGKIKKKMKKAYKKLKMYKRKPIFLGKILLFVDNLQSFSLRLIICEYNVCYIENVINVKNIVASARQHELYNSIYDILKIVTNNIKGAFSYVIKVLEKYRKNKKFSGNKQ